MLNRLTLPPKTPDEALEKIHVADLAGQLVLSDVTTLEELAANQNEARIIALFASMRAREWQVSRPLTNGEAFKLAFVGSL